MKLATIIWKMIVWDKKICRIHLKKQDLMSSLNFTEYQWKKFKNYVLYYSKNQNSC